MDSVRVEIPESANLGRVFRAICDQQKLDCTRADTLSGCSVPKMDGALREVIGNLLYGTDINYRYTRATASTRTKLVLLGHAPKGSMEPLPPKANPSTGVPVHSVRSREVFRQRILTSRAGRIARRVEINQPVQNHENQRAALPLAGYDGHFCRRGSGEIRLARGGDVVFSRRARRHINRHLR